VQEQQKTLASLISRKATPGFLFLVFLLGALCGEGLVLLSHWAAINGFATRYQTFPYLSAILALVLMYDRYPAERMMNLFRTLLILLTGVSFLSAALTYNRKEGRIENEWSLSEMKKELPKGAYGIIGDYWHTYVFAATDPFHIKATPWDCGRNQRWTDSTRFQKTIYLVKDNWIAVFPKDTVILAVHLKYTGDSSRRMGCDFGRYQNLSENPYQ